MNHSGITNSGNEAWLVHQIGQIRVLEQEVSRALVGAEDRHRSYLKSRVQELNLRVELLDDFLGYSRG